MPPARGFCPLDPPFAHPRRPWVCQRFGLTFPPANPAKFSTFPLKEGGQGVRSEKHTPHTPAKGLRPPGPPFAHPRWLGVCQRLGSHSWAGLLRWATRPLFFILGAHPPNPLGGGCASSTPVLIADFSRRDRASQFSNLCGKIKTEKPLGGGNHGRD